MVSSDIDVLVQHAVTPDRVAARLFSLMTQRLHVDAIAAHEGLTARIRTIFARLSRMTSYSRLDERRTFVGEQHELECQIGEAKAMRRALRSLVYPLPFPSRHYTVHHDLI